MSKRIHTIMLLAVALTTFAMSGAENNKPTETSAVRRIVCVGRVEPVEGEVEVSAQMSGTLVAVRVREGDWVAAGAVLAEVDARREKAAVDLAEAKLARVKAGNGAEEIAVAEASRDAVAAELALAESAYRRTLVLSGTKVLADEVVEERKQMAVALRQRHLGATRQAEAMRRGPLPEEVALAEAEIAAARAAYELRLVRATADGAVLELHRHAGDYVSVIYPTPILRLADARRLRVRIEVSEQDAFRIKTGLSGEFVTFGLRQAGGRLVVKTILPVFAPRRLFEPDATARLDTRTLQVVCEIVGEADVFAGQRVTVTILTEPGR